MNKLSFLLFFVLFSISTSGQTVVLKGSIKDSIKNPLAYANIIAKPIDVSKNMSFAISDDLGRYKLELKKDEKHSVSVSYMGHKTVSFIFDAIKNSQKDIVLTVAPNKLDEVIIELPVTVKEDTIIYNTKNFITGEERKLKSVLKKLPGVEVNKKGDVTVQGKKVTKMLVEGKQFFDGGTKLAIENIPANAIDKIEVIDNYNEISFLKNLVDTDEMAMNIKLKEDKKRFLFGDIESGKGNEDYHKSHANLYYYSPKTTVNFIGDINNVGEKTFTFENYMSFQGGISAVLRGDGSVFKFSSSDFAQFMETDDIVDNSIKFGALNISETVANGTEISGYGIFSHNKNNVLVDTNNQYEGYLENINQSTSLDNLLGIGRLKIIYDPKPNNNWRFVTDFKNHNSTKINSIISNILDESKDIKSENESNSFNFNQNIEWHKRISSKHTFSIALNYNINKTDPQNKWETNKSILQNLIPVVPQDFYDINQIITQKTNKINSIIKHYWVLNNINHLYTTFGYNYSDEHFASDEFQILEDNSINNFNDSDFGNYLNFYLNDAFFGIHYKFKKGIFKFKQGFFAHYYNWKLHQQSNTNKNKLVFLPDFQAEISFTKSNKLRLNYQLKSAFSDATNFANRFVLRSYNSVFKGNENLTNELFHSASLFYRRFSLYKGIIFHLKFAYTKKVTGIQNSVNFDQSDRYISPIMVSNPEENINFSFMFSKKIKKIKYMIDGTFLKSNFKQKIDDEFTSSTNDNINIRFSARTLFDKFPVIELGLSSKYGTYNSNINSSKSYTYEPFINIDYDFLKGFIYSFDYIFTDYKNKSFNEKYNYQISNTSLYYKKEDSAWSYKFEVKNLLNQEYKIKNSLYSYYSSEIKTYSFPRVFLFSIGYNL